MANVQAGLLQADKINTPIPVFAPPYRYGKKKPSFDDVNCLAIKYRSEASRIRELLPSNLSIEENPVVTVMFLTYGFSAIGPYRELIHYVEVSFQGKKYDYPILLVLDNEDAVYGGREQWGYPKVLGKLDFDFTADGQSGFLRGSCNRPASNPVIEFLFKSVCPADDNSASQASNPGLNFRVIPNAIIGAPPSVRQYVEANFSLIGGDTWEGVGSLNFPSNSEFDPFHKFPVVEHVSASFTRKCTGAISTPTVVHDF